MSDSDIQRAHELEFEAEHRDRMEMRFKPEVLDNLRDIEMRLAQIESDSSSMASSAEEIRMHLASAVQVLQGASQPQANVPKWAVYAITILLAIIAFK